MFFIRSALAILLVHNAQKTDLNLNHFREYLPCTKLLIVDKRLIVRGEVHSIIALSCCVALRFRPAVLTTNN